VVEHVVVSGGGIAGTTAALALATAGIAATVVETRPADHDGGAVVRINPNGMDALRAVGVHQAVIAESFPLVRSERIGPDGQRVGYRIAADPTSERGLPRVLHWSRLAGVLRAAAQARGAAFRNGSPVVEVDRSAAGVAAVLADGTRVGGDVLIGADGVGSRVRSSIDPDAPAPRWLGTRTVYGYAADPHCEPPPPEVLRAHLGPRGFFAATRDTRTGGCFWFTSLRADQPADRTVDPDVEQLRTELLDRFAGGAGIAATVIEHSERILSFDDHALPHLPRWHDERMIVIGDAAHVAPPASEQGAAIAVEDGVVLAQCLRDLPDPAAAFATFERLRRARVERVVAIGEAGTTRAHHGALGRRLRAVTDRAARLLDWQRRPPTGGPAWAFDHHVDWGTPLA
jgi:2-polyprenyl-6-methoxyphenol hydroxylase-like FAD-dependent oxidoreductase